MDKTLTFKRISRKTIRLDPAPGGGADVDAGSWKRGVWDCILAWVGSSPADRRHAARHEAGGRRLWLGWWDGDRVFTAVSTDLINISRGGALVRAVKPPAELREVWVCLDVTEPSDCVPASVLSVEPIQPGAWAVRFEFGSPCPHSFLSATLAGPAHPSGFEPG